MKSTTAVIKVVYNNTVILAEEVLEITFLFKFFLVINNSTIKINNDFQSISNFDILENHNLNGLAGAYNFALSQLKNINPRFVLFLDDDTDSSSFNHLFEDKFYKVFEDESVAASAPVYIDSNSMTRGSHLLLNRFSFKRIPRTYVGISNVSFMINSCSVWRYDSLKIIGNYDEVMKIDHIDTDYCLRAIENGYKLILNSNYSFFHTIGDRITYKFMCKQLRSGNHSPKRREMIMLNSIIVLRKHFHKFPVFIYIIIERIVYEFIGIMISEKNKLTKLKMASLGIVKGFLLKLS
jgi:rhamnosyltransferase